MTELTLNQIICNNIKRIRVNETKLRQEDLARKAGVSRSTIAAIESSRDYYISTYTLYKISKVLNVSIDDLLSRAH